MKEYWGVGERQEMEKLQNFGGDRAPRRGDGVKDQRTLGKGKFKASKTRERL